MATTENSVSYAKLPMVPKNFCTLDDVEVCEKGRLEKWAKVKEHLSQGEVK